MNTKLKRETGWPKLLHDFVYSRRTIPFAWGANDCALFVADAIHEMTGADLGAGLRGEYSSLAGAVVKMADLTGKPGATIEDVAEYFASVASMSERPNPKFAQRGDVVLFDGANGPAMGILYLDGHNGIFVSQDGLSKIELSACRRAWQVG
jgi:cell wall-associated NlpC family hydrolase